MTRISQTLPDTLTVDLEAMMPSGECQARHEGLLLRVGMGIPGERVEVEVVHRRKTWVRARIMRVLTPSPHRVAPPCPAFGHCGGCDWQHIDYPSQLAFKAGIVREQLARMGGLAQAPVRPCIPSPREYGYRNRIQLVASPRGRLGYRARNTPDVVEIDGCPIADAAINALLPGVQLRAGEMADLRAHDAGATASPADALRVTVGHHTYRAGGQAFFQVNTAVAALLVDAVLDALRLRGHERVLDLFCGVGLFTLPVALAAGHTTGVESNPASCADALFNLRPAGEKARVMAMDAGDALNTPAFRDGRWDAVVANPPRAGIGHAALLRLAALGAPKVVYVSCNPATLARDARLLRARGYALQCAQPFDMFPHTHHVETMALFQRV